MGSRNGALYLKGTEQVKHLLRSSRTHHRPSAPTYRRRHRGLRLAYAALLPSVLAAGLLTPPPVFAADSGADASEDRGLTVEFWRTGGAGVKEAAEKALLGGPEDIKKFLDDKEGLQRIDDRVDVSRIINAGGPQVREAAKKALASENPDDVAAFVQDGWKAPLQVDQRVEVSRIINLGGNGVQDAGKAALEGTPEDVTKFLAEGQYEARKVDNRVKVSQLIYSGGPAMKAAAKIALQGTPEDVQEFLEIGQFTARNRDQEHATIAQLNEQAVEAGKQADDATKASQEASAKAIAASELAKAAAETAAKETAAAKDESQKAALKAKQAAEAAKAAAAAAQTAIDAANAANRSARIAAMAAAQTASAAAAAARAADDAYRASIAALGDKNKAEEAKNYAKNAQMAGALARTSALTAQQAAKASLAAATAVSASRSATSNANSAAASADEADTAAQAAGVHSGVAAAAAAETRRHANEANRAANAAEALARKSAAAALEAGDHANKAATHADNAAAAAEDAAKHAGDATRAAAESNKQADKAKEAADEASAAVATAKKVFAIARETEAEELTTRTNAAIERAKSSKAATDDFTKQLAQVALEDAAITKDAEALVAEADKDGADTKTIAVNGRAVALRALKQYGSWRQEAAAQALSGTDADVLDYLRTGARKAVSDEARQQVTDLASNSPYDAVRTGAASALSGTDQQVHDFLVTGQYEVAATDYRVLISKISNEGGPSVKEAAKATLVDGSAKVVAAFVNSGQYQARNIDERVIATKRANDGGPEVKGAAMAALQGPADQLHDFVQAGQYMADRKDQLTNNHVAQVQRLINEADGIAATAQKNRWLAAKAAAEANQAKDEANAAAAEADRNAKLAAGYASDAKASADRAEASANQAAKSAVTARNAADAADRDAAAAAESAAQAEFSAKYARDSAYAANDAKRTAQAAAVDAGKSAAEANTIASQAWDDVLKKRQGEEAEARRQAEELRKQEEAQSKKHVCMQFMSRDSLAPCRYDENAIVEVPTVDPRLAQLLLQGGMEVLGISDLLECVENPTLGQCTMAVIGVLPVGKLRLAKKAAEGVEEIAEGSRIAKAAEKCAECFLAGTKVLMADRTQKNIETVKVGDSVVATDPLTGQTGARAVTDLIVTEHDKQFNEITISTRRGAERITATYEHPFWSPSENAWLKVSYLRAGMTLRTIDGSSVTIVNNRSFTENARTYNLTIGGLHTYYVMAGDTPILVHNAEKCKNLNLSAPLPKGMTKEIVQAYDTLKRGELESHDIYSGREFSWWKGAEEYRVPNAPETQRLLVKRFPNGIVAIGWTATHYKQIQRFESPHFPDWGWPKKK
ncbi:polymorphic toxin-type HINT domain-containing protein [Streptomyces violascens]|uniref:polymorphic toxin-type HINT domain-containing protein n=1 Tax=Streptomyces violascens TaxID=67381 RepID=UPI0036AB57D1